MEISDAEQVGHGMPANRKTFNWSALCHDFSGRFAMDRRIIRWGVLVVLVTTTATWGTTTWAKSIFSRKPAPTSPATKPSPEIVTIKWLHDLKAAHKESVATGKPMLVVFSGPKCFYCRKLENEVFTQPTVAKYINKAFVPVHLDLDKNRPAAEVLEVTSLPTSVILSSDADLLGSVEGFVSSREFAEVLHRSIVFQKNLKEEQAVATRDEK
jgi:thioredoxin-related protein